MTALLLVLGVFAVAYLGLAFGGWGLISHGFDK